MKYLILVGDGMGDWPRDELDGSTPLQAAATPNMDRLAASGRLGLAQTIPQGMQPGSDTANMSLMGFDPAKYHTGRSPIEAAAMGVDLRPGEIAFRCNLVTISWNGDQTIMEDYSAGHIDTPGAARIIADLDKALGRSGFKFHPGVSYRHLLVWQDGPRQAATVPPHDRTGQPVDDTLAGGQGLDLVGEAIKDSWPLLKDHPVNQQRAQAGNNQANSIWLWGQGTKPQIPKIPDQFGLSGFTVSAVDLIHGLGVLAGLTPVEVPGATGFLDTNFAGKVAATIEGLREKDLAFLHVEAPDEAGHSGVLDTKLEAIELFDSKVVGPVLEGLKDLGPHRVLLATDHYTPLEIRTHSLEPVPFVIWDSENKIKGGTEYSEPAAAEVSGQDIQPASELLKQLVEVK